MEAFVSNSADLERLVRGANYFDDLDIIHSPVDGAMVSVCVRGGKHACWQCGAFFDDGVPALKRTEVKLGYTRILLHARCEKGRPTIQAFWSKIKGHQARRFATKATKNIGG